MVPNSADAVKDKMLKNLRHSTEGSEKERTLFDSNLAEVSPEAGRGALPGDDPASTTMIKERVESLLVQEYGYATAYFVASIMTLLKGGYR
jgi:hypothetical protein